MLKLNIISPELKKEIKYKFFYITLKNILFIILISLLTHTSLLLTAKYVLRAHANETNNRNILIGSQTEDYNKKVKNINDQVSYIEKIQKDTVLWSEFTEILSHNINSGISIINFSVNQKSNVFVLSGYAKTRQDLLNLKSSLEELKIFNDITIPIDVLLKKENINFSINTSFNSYEFK